MNKNTKGILTVLAVSAMVYIAYKYLKGRPPWAHVPPFDQMRDELWAFQVKNIPDLAQHKDAYYKTQSWNDVEYLHAWYAAYKNGKDVFKYKGKTWATKNGLGISL